MNKILDYFYSLLETYSAKINSFSWSKRWKNREEGTGYQTNESWIDGYRKWKKDFKMKKKKELTKTQYQECFAKAFSYVAQIFVALFFIAVLIYTIF